MGTQIINIEEIITELRQEARAKNMTDIESFDDVCCFGLKEDSDLESFNREELLYEMKLANQSFIVSPDIALTGKFQFIKRIIRKFNYFLIRQFAERATEYNRHIIRSMNQIRNYIFHRYEDDKNIEELKAIVAGEVTSKIAAQTSRIREISKENLELKQQILQCVNQSKSYQESLQQANAQIELLKIKLEIIENKYQYCSK